MLGRWLLFAAAMMLVGAGCTYHEVDVKPIKIEPIHITVDINVKLQKEFEDLFAFEEKAEPKAKDDSGSDKK